MSDIIADAIRDYLGERCSDFDPGCLCCRAWAEYDEIARLRAENERLRAALRAAFDAGSEVGWDHATYSERGGPEPIGHEDAFAAFLAALDGQPAQPLA